jgi:hypothetical protein
MKVDKARRSDISHARKVHKLEDVHRCSMYPLPILPGVSIWRSLHFGNALLALLFHGF